MVKSKYFACKHRSCKSLFNSKKALNAHILEMHCNFDVYECEICHKSLSTKQSLKEHRNTHTGNRPYKCPFAGCNETFRQSSQLSTHKKVHKLSMEFAKQERNYTEQSGRSEGSVSSNFLPSVDLSQQTCPSSSPKLNF